MIFGVKTLAGMVCFAWIGCAIGLAECPVDTVIVKGRVEHVPLDAKVRVQLIYAKEVAGESGEVSVENGMFSIPIEFLTLSKRPLIHNLPEKCERKPRTVNITLIGGGQESEPVSLDFVKEFKSVDASAYALRTEVVLEGAR